VLVDGCRIARRGCYAQKKNEQRSDSHEDTLPDRGPEESVELTW
jgi:hypothetical protein